MPGSTRKNLKGRLKIALRADGSVESGFGHLHRFALIAGALREALPAAKIFFVTRDFPEAVKYLDAKGQTSFPVHRGLEPERESARIAELLGTVGCDLLICDLLQVERDYYGDGDYVRRLTDANWKSAALDCYTDSAALFDLVVNSLYDEGPSGDNVKSGLEYLVLNRPTAEPRLRDAPVERIVAAFGGTDPSEHSEDLLELLGRRDFPGIIFDLVVGAGCPRLDKILKAHATLGLAERVNVLTGVSDFGAVLDRADIALTSGGLTAYECAAAGLPVVVVCHNDAESAMHRPEIAEFGILLGDRFLGDDVAAALDTIIADGALRRSLSEAGPRRVDGRGLERTAGLLAELARGRNST